MNSVHKCWISKKHFEKREAIENELDFIGINVECINIGKDVPKIEKMNNLKINIHIYQNGQQGCRYNNYSMKASRTDYLLLVVNEDGYRHYCGITSLKGLYGLSMKIMTYKLEKSLFK